MPAGLVPIEDQSFFKQESMSFFEVKKHKLSDSIDLKIILAKPTYPIVYDGELKILYLLTVDKSGKVIDHVRIGKTEGVAEYNFLETSLIENNSILRSSDESTYEEDSINGGGERVHTFKSDSFKITNEGKIKHWKI